MILTRFFEGKWDRLGTYNEANEIEAQLTFPLYSDEEDAAAKIFGYLQNPPQIEHYRTNIKPTIQWYPAVDEVDRKLAAAHLEVVLPLPNLDLKSGTSSATPQR